MPPAGFERKGADGLAELERGIIRERVNTGIAAAKQRGVHRGRARTLQGRNAEVVKLQDQGLGVRAIARQLNMPVSSVHSLVKSAASKVLARLAGNYVVSHPSGR